MYSSTLALMAGYCGVCIVYNTTLALIVGACTIPRQWLLAFSMGNVSLSMLCTGSVIAHHFSQHVLRWQWLLPFGTLFLFASLPMISLIRCFNV